MPIADLLVDRAAFEQIDANPANFFHKTGSQNLSKKKKK
jgi:hypothetical protein